VSASSTQGGHNQPFLQDSQSQQTDKPCCTICSDRPHLRRTAMRPNKDDSLTENMHSVEEMSKWSCRFTQQHSNTKHSTHDWPIRQQSHMTTTIWDIYYRLANTTILGPFSGTTWVSRCQKKTSRLYGARED